jgi:hypothetical protein
MTRGRKIRDPRVEALAFRIWVWCRDREWRTTVGEIAEALDMNQNSVRAICAHRGWSSRLGGVVSNGYATPTNQLGMLMGRYGRAESVEAIVRAASPRRMLEDPADA